MIEKPGNIPNIETCLQASILKPQQVPQNHNSWGISREQNRFKAKNSQKDIHPGTSNNAGKSNFIESQNKKNQSWGVSMEKNCSQQGIWQLSNTDAENSSFKESQIKRSQPWDIPMERTCSLSQQKEIGIRREQNVWQFPKRSVTMRQEIPTQVLSRNRFQILAEAESEEKNSMPTRDTFENDNLQDQNE